MDKLEEIKAEVESLRHKVRNLYDQNIISNDALAAEDVINNNLRQQLAASKEQVEEEKRLHQWSVTIKDYEIAALRLQLAEARAIAERDEPAMFKAAQEDDEELAKLRTQLAEAREILGEVAQNMSVACSPELRAMAAKALAKE